MDDLEGTLLGIESVFFSFSGGVDVDQFSGFFFQLFLGDGKIRFSSDLLLFASIKSFLSFFKGSGSFFDFTGSEFEFSYTFFGLFFVELIVSELFSMDFIFVFIKDSGDGVHWSSVFKDGFDLGHNVHDGSLLGEFEGSWVFFHHW